MDGSLNFLAKIDYSDIEKSVNEMTELFESGAVSIEQAFNFGKTVDKTTIELRQMVSVAKQAVKEFETAYDATMKEIEEGGGMKNASEGQKEYLAKLKDAIKVARAEISGLSENIKNSNKNNAESMRALSSAVQGIMGAYAAARGVLAMFGADEEKLDKIQTALQSSMAILMGLQQVHNTLMEVSAFRTQIVTKATLLYAKAQEALAKSSMLAKLGIAGLVAAVAIGAIKIISSLNEISKKRKEDAEEFKSYTEKVSGDLASQVVAFRKLQQEWKNANGSLKEQEKLVIKNKDAWKQLGLSVNSVTDYEKYSVDKAADVLRAMEEKAEAAAKLALAVEHVKEAVKAQMKAEDEQSTEPTFGQKVVGSIFGALFGVPYDEIYKKQQEANRQKFEQQAQKETDKAGKLISQSLDVSGNAGEFVGPVQPATRDKKYWEDQKQYYEDQLKALASNELNSEKALAIKRKIEQIQAEIDKYSLSKDKTKANKEQERKDKAAEKALKVQVDSEHDALESEQLALRLKQEELNTRKEGYLKQKDQIDLDYQNTILELKQNRQRWIEELRDKKANELLAENPDATKEQVANLRMSITEKDLSDEQKKAIDDLTRYAAEQQKLRQQQAFDDMLQQTLGYFGKREKAEKEYNDKMAALYKDWNKETQTGTTLNDGVSQENIDEANRQREEALRAIDEEFAMRSDEFVAWSNQIANASIKTLLDELERAKAALDAMEENGETDSQKLAEGRAKVAKIEKAISTTNAENKAKGPDKRTLKEWEDLYKVLSICEKEFESIGDTIGGTVGEIMRAAGQIATSTLQMINGIAQLAQDSVQATEDAAKTTSKTIQTVEKASVILAIIGAALQVAMKIAEMFNDDDDKQAEIDKLQERINDLQWQMEHSDIVRIQQEYGKATERVAQALKAYNEELTVTFSNLLKSKGLFGAFFSMQEERTKALARQAEGLADAYAKMSYSVDKALGEARFSDAKDQLRNLSQQQLLIQQQIELERSKKKTDDKAIAEYEKKIEELGAQAVSLINELVEEIIGGSSQDIANELSDAFFEAFQNGTDYAQAWGDKVEDIVADIIKRMLVSQYLEEPLGAVFDKYKAKWFREGDFIGAQNVIASMAGFAADLNAVGDDFRQIWDALPSDVMDMLTATTEASREASQRGIATASQDSVDELNGRMTAVQGHTYSIAESSRMLALLSSEILAGVLNIESHTRRLEAVESGVREVRDTLNDISLKGLKIK